MLANLFRRIADILKSPNQNIIVNNNEQLENIEIGVSENTNVQDNSEIIVSENVGEIVYDESKLKKDILIRLENVNVNEVSYRYISSNNWLSGDKFFDSTQDYLTGIDTIVGKLQQNGRILVYPNSGRIILSANDFNNKGEVVNRIIELLRN